jgi:DNA repair exonuclease SbcCD ATPase subunit
MSLGIVTTISNNGISERLKGMLADLKVVLTDLRSTMTSLYEQIQKIKQQAKLDGLSEYDTNLLIKTYLKEFLNDNQIKYILNDKARRAEKKKLLEKNVTVPETNKDIPDIPAPDYKIVVPDQVIEEAITPQQQQQEYKPDYALENLRSQIESYKSQIEELIADKKNIEEKYKQLEAKTLLTPSNSIPTLRGNNLRTKIVVTQLFREVLALKGGKMIYANILIDLSQNKYVRLEPFEERGV